MGRRSNGRLAASSSRLARLRLVTKWLTNWSSEARRMRRARNVSAPAIFEGVIACSTRGARCERSPRAGAHFGEGTPGCRPRAAVDWRRIVLVVDIFVLCGGALTASAVHGRLVEHPFVDLFKRKDETVPAEDSKRPFVRGLPHADSTV